MQDGFCDVPRKLGNAAQTAGRAEYAVNLHVSDLHWESACHLSATKRSSGMLFSAWPLQMRKPDDLLLSKPLRNHMLHAKAVLQCVQLT